MVDKDDLRDVVPSANRERLRDVVGKDDLAELHLEAVDKDGRLRDVDLALSLVRLRDEVRGDELRHAFRRILPEGLVPVGR